MDRLQSTIPIGKIEEENKERDFFEDVSTSWDIASLSFGDGVDVASRNKTFENYPDYKDNEQSYKAYSDMSVWYRSAKSESTQRHFIDKAIEEKKFILDESGNVVAGENASPISMYMYDMDAVKGGLLARRNGWNKQVSDQAYIDETAKQSKELATKAKGSSIGAKIIGTLAGYAFREETAIEVAASPAKIVGSTIFGGMGKAFVTEFAIGAFGETLREKAIQEHMAKANLDYTLWDSAKNILIGAGLAGSIRGIGSGVVDANILRKVDSSGLEATDKEILNRYFRREQYKLTTNSRANIELLHKVEDDINRGKEVDVSEFTDIDINTKTDELIPENSMPDEISKINRELGIQKDLDNINKHIDEIKPLQEVEDDIYDGMATPKEADELFAEMGEIDPEIKAELEVIKAERKKVLSPQAEAVREAKEPTIGGSEDEAKQAVKNLFRKNTSEEARYKSMSKEDIAEVERIAREDIIDSKPAGMSDEDWVEANQVFAKGIDNIAAGTIAGVETDEQGNITFDAEKFVLGLGGYTAVKAILTNPKVQSELKGWAERAINELETNPKFDMVTGTQRAVQQAGGGTRPKIGDTFDGYSYSTPEEIKELFHSGNLEQINPDKILWTTGNKDYALRFGKKDTKQLYQIEKENLNILDGYSEEGKKLLEEANQKAVNPMKEVFNPDGGVSSFVIQDDKVIQYLRDKGYDAVRTSESYANTNPAVGIINPDKVKINPIQGDSK